MADQLEATIEQAILTIKNGLEHATKSGAFTMTEAAGLNYAHDIITKTVTDIKTDYLTLKTQFEEACAELKKLKEGETTS